VPKNPLAEVFGFPTTNGTPSAERHWSNKLCPFNNKVPNCTKDRATDPLGVCSIHHGGSAVITCPVRFREDWIITNDAARFFFPDGAAWTTLVEVRLADANGQSAGNIDVVLASYDENGSVTDFGALEVQAVYISGNVRNPFYHFIADRTVPMNWEHTPLYPRPDYLSSSRKRLAPQLLFKGGILHAWGKKQAVALQTSFYRTLPELQTVNDPAEADMVWLLYDLEQDQTEDRLRLVLKDALYTGFENALQQITQPRVGPMETFLSVLQRSLDNKLNSPDTRILIEPSDS
jgi:hypothetical protein